jgi:hypothetical protein
MQKENHQAGQNQDNLDRALDAALAKYAALEPRAGLEERILANLRTAEASVPPRAWWHCGVAATVAALVVIAVALAVRSGKPSPPLIVMHAPARIQAPRTPQQSARSNATEVPPVRQAAHKRAPHPHRPETVVAANPKLDQFPSPQPLTEQEKLLASYVAQFRDEAVMVARARAEDLRVEREQESREAEADANHGVQAR